MSIGGRSFRGSEAYTIPYSGDFNGTNAWMYMTSALGTPDGASECIISAWLKMASTSARYGGFAGDDTFGGSAAQVYHELNGGSADNFHFGSAGTALQYNVNPAGYSTNWQHHLISVSTGAASGSKVRYWLDGSEKSLTAAHEAGGEVGFLANGNQPCFGQTYWNAGGNWFSGKMCQWGAIDGLSIQGGDYAATDFYNSGAVDLTGLTSFGANGFLIDDPSTGTDTSGNANHFTRPNVSQSTDTPTA